ncbi:MAG: SpoIIE family protein phosphatase, partial [Desulfuromonadales bacterium]|nr:SpoIIE family protein phosphatase [Desulfuromonadales bacterium]
EQLYRDKKLTEAQAQQGALDWLRSVQSKAGYQWLIMDHSAQILAHSEHELEGSSIAEMTDVKGRKLAPLLSNPKRSYLVNFAVFYWNSEKIADAGKKLGCFKSFSQWGWTLITLVDIQDLEEETAARKAEALDSLKKSFASIRIAQTGATFLFDGAGEMLIAPPAPLAEDLLERRDAASGDTVLQTLLTATENEQTEASLTLSQPGVAATPYQLYFSYFKPFDWYIAAAIPLEEIALPARQVTTRLTQVIALIFLVSLTIAYVFVSRISEPLIQLSSFATELPNHDFSAPMQLDPAIEKLSIGRKDEVGRLAESFSFMVQELEGNIQRLVESTAARERMAEELNIARKIQMGILPKNFPAFPERSEFDLFALLDPAKEVGGDLYDFFLIDDRRLCFTLGDVSDKGIPAALFMAITRTLIKTTAQHFDSTAEIMTQVNAMLSADNPNTMFVTLVVGIIDLESGEVRYANGGHNPPVIMKQKNQVAYMKEISGPVVGVIDELEYKELHLTLKPDDALFLYTDGVTEAMNETRVQFGDDRLLEALGEDTALTPETTIHKIMSHVRDHAGDAAQSDDIAMLMIRYHGISKESLS